MPVQIHRDRGGGAFKGRLNLQRGTGPMVSTIGRELGAG